MINQNGFQGGPQQLAQPGGGGFQGGLQQPSYMNGLNQAQQGFILNQQANGWRPPGQTVTNQLPKTMPGQGGPVQGGVQYHPVIQQALNNGTPMHPAIISALQNGQPIHPAITDAMTEGYQLHPDVINSLQSGYQGGQANPGGSPGGPPQQIMQGLNPVQQNFIRQQQANGWRPPGGVTVSPMQNNMPQQSGFQGLR